MERPKMAIIDPNTLAMLGLKNILQNVMPIIDVSTFGNFDEFQAAGPQHFIHYFVAQTIVLENLSFFREHIRQTMVLTISSDPNSCVSGFHSFCTNVPEDVLVREILKLEHRGHPHGEHQPEMPQVLKNKILSNREIEVLSLIVQGFINKEIADRLNISLTTVISHRKNIMDKLGMKSVSALTIYAVMHGYVDINNI